MLRTAVPVAIVLLVAAGVSAASILGAPAADAACTIRGTAGPDVLRGTPRADVICGLGGDDTLVGYGGNDRLLGGPGRDQLDGGPGSDTLLGEGGDDWLIGMEGRDVHRGGPGADYVWARDGLADIVDGGAGRDRARVDRTLDTLLGIEAS